MESTLAKIWMVRAGRQGSALDWFLSRKRVAVGHGGPHDLSGFDSKSELDQAFRSRYPDRSKSKARHSVAIQWKILKKIEDGDSVLTYDPSQRIYHFGRVVGPYQFDPEAIAPESNSPELPHYRPVSWEQEIPRDELSAGARNALGSMLTIFELRDDVAADIIRAIKGEPAPIEEEGEADIPAPEAILEEAEGKSIELIKDLIRQLDWEEMQEFVAAILRTLGYKTRVSPAGSDRGKDIVASPDGLGLSQVRIKVEVKHRPGTKIDAPLVRSFLGGLRPNDRGLYVSTGGYTREAYYEADRSQVPVELLTLEELAELWVANYDSVASDDRAMLPLKRVYFPAES